MKTKGGSTPNALLGLLSLRPMSGYDIRQLISRSIGHFWSESYGQIYPGLKQLAAAGLVEKKTERNKGKPDRHLYSITQEGRERLREWLKIPVSEEVARNELLLKLFFGSHVSASVNREHVMANMEFHQRALKVYAATAKQLRLDEANDPQLPYWLMTLNYGRHYSGAVLKWCKETLAELDAIESKGKRRQ
ncbi:PadR family transcriptional regulator [Tunturiibacter gelidoferens]|jgi:PadR family transcriptional regulator AphA|uniref:DNA-binding PadR family transcriptional regulator n=1 Tax=Tunturiibacter gelidiferens TaxID=3069689 RepID=A0A9X0U4C4_9BACT|nr:PadR family transcriptional regulator [Edaphobacter lichenicola]MBB5327712.1 DNA-binding PadR family transcriptional regulator [Edaphobacter lichenicola]